MKTKRKLDVEEDDDGSVKKLILEKEDLSEEDLLFFSANSNEVITLRLCFCL